MNTCWLCWWATTITIDLQWWPGSSQQQVTFVTTVNHHTLLEYMFQPHKGRLGCYFNRPLIEERCPILQFPKRAEQDMNCPHILCSSHRTPAQWCLHLSNALNRQGDFPAAKEKYTDAILICHRFWEKERKPSALLGQKLVVLYWDLTKRDGLILNLYVELDWKLL